MNIVGERIKYAVKANLGWELAENPQSVGINKPNILCCGEHYAIVTCIEEDKPYIEAMYEMEMLPDDKIKYIVKAKARRLPAGKGFGDKVWRENSQHNGIELSFEKRPDEKMRTELKALGFRWSRMGGVWYLPLKKMTPAVADFLTNYSFTKVEGA